MSRCSDRGAVEPIVALVAVFAVAVAVALYAGVVDRAFVADDRDIAEPVADRVADELSVAGVADPDRREAAIAAVPDRYHVRVRLTTEQYDWRAGPDPEGDASVSRRRVGVRVGPSDVRPGRLTVVVWR